MSLVEHAEAELRRTGWLDEENRESGEAMLGAVREFAKGGWSGGSAPFGIAIVRDLLQFKPLGPLTDDPDEWTHISEGVAGQPDCWQSRRRPDAFSNDGGKTYYCLDELPVHYGFRGRIRKMVGGDPVGSVGGHRSIKLLKRHRSMPARVLS